MPLIPADISRSISTQMRLYNLKGRDVDNLSSAIGSAIYSSVTRPNMVTCSLNGTAGPFGSLYSTVVVGLVPRAMSSFMLSKAATKSYKGRDIRKVFDAISNGIVLSLYKMILSGKTSGIALGAGFGTFTALSDTLMSREMVLKMRSRGLKGRDIQGMCDCISFGVVNHLKTSVKFQVVVTGTVAPTPPTGPIAVVSIPSIYTKIR